MSGTIMSGASHRKYLGHHICMTHIRCFISEFCRGMSTCVQVLPAPASAQQLRVLGGRDARGLRLMQRVQRIDR